MAKTPRKPGWYTHPSMRGALQYWDGSDWTDDIGSDRPSAPSAGSIAFWIVLAFVLLAVVVLVLANL